MNDEMGAGRDIEYYPDTRLMRLLTRKELLLAVVIIAAISGFASWVQLSVLGATGRESMYSILTTATDTGIQLAGLLYFIGLALVILCTREFKIAGWMSSMIGIVLFWLCTPALDPYHFQPMTIGIGQIIGVACVVLLFPIVLLNARPEME